MMPVTREKQRRLELETGVQVEVEAKRFDIGDGR